MGSRSIVAIAITLVALGAPIASAEGLAPPSPPQDLEVETTASGTELSWSAPLYDGGSPVLYYNVYRGDTLLAQVTSNAYVDDSVAMAAASSSYHVTAVNQVGESVAAFHSGACINLTSSPPAVHPINCAESVVDFVLWLIDNTP